MNPTKADAISALADLIPAKKVAQKDGTIKEVSITSLIRPLWEPTAITIFHQETECLHCNTVYRFAKPTITLTETHTRRPDKKRHTSSPPKSAIPNDLPIHTEVIHEAPILHCVSCVNNLNPTDIYLALAFQADDVKQSAAREFEEKKAQAANRNFTPKDDHEGEYEITELADDTPSLEDLL